MSRLARTLALRLAWLASLAACSSGVAPLSPGLRRELTGYDYAVYSAWLFAQRSRGMVLVDDRTTSTSYPGLSVIRSSVIYQQPVVCPVGPRPTVPPPTIVPPPVVVPPPPPVVTPPPACGAPGGQPIPVGPQSPAREEASQDQRVQQEASAPLEPDLKGAVYRLVRDPVPEGLMRQAGLIVAFSRAGFDSRLEVATFQVLLAPVYGGRLTDAAAYRVWVERTGTRWELVEVELVGPVGAWITTTEPGVATPQTMTCDSTRTTNCMWPPGTIPVPLPLPRPK